MRRTGRMFAALLGLTGSLLLPALASALPPGEVVLEYELAHNGTVLADLRERLVHDGRRYRIESEGRGRGVLALASRGSVRRSSEGLITPEGLRPLEFRDQRGNRPAEIASFDWAAGRVRTARDGRPVEHRLMPPAQDKLSFPWSFAFSPPGAADPAPLPVFTMVDGRGAHAERYRFAGREPLELPAGRFHALRLVRDPQGEQDRRTELWLAAGRHHLPLRIVVTEADGSRTDQRLVRIGSGQ